MWIYEQANGKMSRNNAILAVGYSGAGPHKNDPYSQNIPDQGPIPQGGYTIQPPIDSPTHGPCAMHLLPDSGNQMFGRSEFLIHGDSVKAPGTASMGCIILPRFARDRIVEGLATDNRLQVVDQMPIPELDQWESIG